MGGAHTNNPGFSSTKGVQISMSRFNDTKINFKSGTVEIGAGLKWGQVYAALEPTRVSVVGARFHDVGVAGSTLGGGECLPSLGCRISYAFRLFIQVKSVWTDG
jgi:FAD/FMN-containing dehydrogenase